MRRPHHILLTMHADERFLVRLGRAASTHFVVRPVESWDTIWAVFPCSPPGTLVLVDPYRTDGRSGSALSPDLGAFLAHFPSAVVVAAFWLRQGSYRDSWTLSRMGVSELLILDEENTEEAIRRRLASARSRPVRSIIDGLPFPVPGRAQALMAAAAEVVVAGGQVADLARSLAITHRTLYRWCLRSRLPAPKDLMRWLRGLHAAAMLDDPGQTVVGVAQACGYTDDRGLQRLCRDLVELTPSDLRERGAFDIVERAFHRELRSLETRPSAPLLVGMP